MGANAQTAVPVFTAGQILTAAQMTQVNTGIPVFSTTVTRDAAFGSAGEKTLAQGQYAYIEATSALMVYSGSAWSAVGGGLTYITQATPSAQTSISINNCFTSTYENYRIVLNLSTFVTDGNISLRLRVGGVDNSTNYVSQRLGANGATVFASANVLGTDEMYIMSGTSAEPRTSAVAFDMFAPQLATDTTCVTHFGVLDVVNGSPLITTWNAQNSNTAFDGFTLIGTSAITGTIRVYGYQNS
jgi:hypothetical protein